jgi:hypothetical protein
MDVQRIRQEFGFEAASLLDDLPELLDVYRGRVTPRGA